MTAAALAVAAVAPGFGVFLAAMALVGVTSVVAQVLIPLAAHLAPPQSRGTYVGQVTGGLLLGIMLARSVARLAAAAWGWRSIYALSAGVMLATAVAGPVSQHWGWPGVAVFAAILVAGAGLVWIAERFLSR